MSANLNVRLETSPQTPSKTGVQVLAQAREQRNARMQQINAKPTEAAPRYDFVGIAG
ncbi:hypothetical protein [Marinobacterium rhizophilum]|uniref:Uncharacterized protein n=1 Tax=Marinobacterium rhizophilum TaxID=420402 RepID=A0ABY5HID3_9GAMM|nr:hypothetical protein [Marinobacterium rhizophilum]UTW11373.1 hypothetical protein KDW95_19250 [Marinobacterium rhizophilum]